MEKFIIEEADVKKRLDVYLAERLDDLSRSQIKNLIKKGKVLVNNEKVKVKHSLHENDEVFVKDIDTSPFKIIEKKRNLEIVFENSNLLIINKPPGLVVHPSDSSLHDNNTVINALISKISDVDKYSDQYRPGIVHRLDKDSSGLLILAKNKRSYDYLIGQFKDKKIKKSYLTLVQGKLTHKEGLIDSPIGRDVKDRKKMSVVGKLKGKSALSEYKVLKEIEIDGAFFSLVKINLITGRTHQIRVHMSAIGHSVVGDQVYGNRNVNKLFKEIYGLERQFLHAFKLSFLNMNGELLDFEIDLAEDLNGIV